MIDPDRLSIGSYNVENLDPVIEDRALVEGDADVDDDVGEGKFAAIAEQIVADLGAPAILALQEIQDNDGAERTRWWPPTRHFNSWRTRSWRRAVLPMTSSTCRRTATPTAGSPAATSASPTSSIPGGCSS